MWSLFDACCISEAWVVPLGQGELAQLSWDGLATWICQSNLGVCHVKELVEKRLLPQIPFIPDLP